MEAVPKGEKLIEAIASADESTLRVVMRALCAEDEPTQELIGKYLYEVANFTPAEAKGSKKSSLKRKAESPVQICIQCNQVFEENDNREDSCRYHPKNTAINSMSSVWDNADERTWNDLSLEEKRRDPDLRRGFYYMCCKRSAKGSEGCATGYHRAADGKRGKFGTKFSEHGEDDEGDENEEDEEDEDDEWYSSLGV